MLTIHGRCTATRRVLARPGSSSSSSSDSSSAPSVEPCECVAFVEEPGEAGVTTIYCQCSHQKHVHEIEGYIVNGQFVPKHNPIAPPMTPTVSTRYAHAVLLCRNQYLLLTNFCILFPFLLQHIVGSDGYIRFDEWWIEWDAFSGSSQR